MLLNGRTFSAVIHGRIEIFALNAKGQITIQMGDGNSIITDAQIFDCLMLQEVK